MLVATEFAGKTLETAQSPVVAGGKEVDLKTIFKKIDQPGCYLIYAVPVGKSVNEFIGTPLVVSIRSDKRGATEVPVCIHIEPLRYALMSTDHGDLTLAFYYDMAPNTTGSFLGLAEQGFYDGLVFHRIVPGFVVQGGDPTGSGMGGPGYQIDAEFNERLHEEGVLSMARTGDPLEPQGMPPRCEFANSAGSQFFICLARKEHLDRRYTAFGRVVSGMDSVRSMAKVPIVDQKAGRPEKPPVIRKVEVKAVTAQNNPYRELIRTPASK